METVVLCCEAGDGRGHMVKLSIVAKALKPFADITALVGRTDQAQILMPYCKAIYPAAAMRRIDDARLKTELLHGQQGILAQRWTSWLAKGGFFSEDTLRTRFAWWHETFLRLRPALVVAEYCPTALLAARALGIPCCATGNAYGLPPATMESFPSLATGQDNGIVLDETMLLDVVNAVVVPYGLPPLTRLPAIYQSDIALPTGVKLWDPYADWRQEQLVLPVEKMPPLAEGTGTELFIYFSVNELEESAILDAVAALDMPARCFAPKLSGQARARLASNPNIRIENAPLSQREIVARARMVLCAGQAGTLALSVLSGLPVVALPRQSEQATNARAAAQLASCRHLIRPERTKDSILSAISEIWSDPSAQSAGRQAAETLRADYSEDALQAYQRCLGPIVAKRRNLQIAPLI